MHILYHYPYSQHARRVVSLFEVAGLEYELVHVAMDQQEYQSPEYRQINPNGQVPTLVDGEIKIHESNAILRYLCVKHGLTDWYPDELAARARVEQWLDWTQCRLSPSVVDVVLNKAFLGEHGDQEAIARGMAKLPGLMEILDGGLADRAFLAGELPTIADLAVASCVFQLGLADAMPTQANVRAWFDRVSGIEGFQKSLPQG